MAESGLKSGFLVKKVEHWLNVSSRGTKVPEKYFVNCFSVPCFYEVEA